MKMNRIAQGVPNRTGMGGAMVAAVAAVSLVVGGGIGWFGTDAYCRSKINSARAANVQAMRNHVMAWRSTFGMVEPIMKENEARAQSESAENIIAGVGLDEQCPPETLAKVMVALEGGRLERLFGMGAGEVVKQSPAALEIIQKALDAGKVKDIDACVQLSLLMVEASLQQ